MSQFIQSYPMWILLGVGAISAFLRLTGLGIKPATAIGLGLLLVVAYLSTAQV